MTLCPKLERFAAEAVASRRYRHMSQLGATAVARLQRAEADRMIFAKVDAA